MRLPENCTVVNTNNKVKLYVMVFAEPSCSDDSLVIVLNNWLDSTFYRETGMAQSTSYYTAHQLEGGTQPPFIPVLFAVILDRP